MRDRIVPLVSVVALALAWLGGGTALAAGTAVDAAITVFAEVGGDKVKLAAFCEMTRLMSEDPDLPKDDGVYRRIDVAMNTLGAEFQQVWNLSRIRIGHETLSAPP